jgi:hypothetical protein
MYQKIVEYQCPTCNAGYGSLPEKAGHNTSCSNCKTNFMVPVGLTPTFVAVSAPAVIAEVMPQQTAAVPGTVPIRLQMPGGHGALEVPVDQRTANSLAKTFLGGLLVAIGVALAAMMGARKR